MRCKFLMLIMLAQGLIAAVSSDPVVFVVPGGIAIEAERGEPPHGWSYEHDIAGYQGEGYLRWSAPNTYSAPGSGVLTYRFVIPETGRYYIRLRVNTAGAERRDLGNDVFTRCDGSAWTKTFIGGGSPNGWAMRTKLEPQHGKFAEPIYDLEVGLHTFEISGRSHGLRLDRLLIWREDEKAPSDAIIAASGLPPIPSEIDDQLIRETWAKGGLGAVWSWANKSSKHPGAEPALQALESFAEAQLAQLTKLRNEQVLVAVELLEILCVQYQGSSPGRDLLKTLRSWYKDPAVAGERKAQQAVSNLEPAIEAYRRIDNTQKKAEAAQRLAVVVRQLRTRYPDTIAVAAAVRRLKSLGVAIE